MRLVEQLLQINAIRRPRVRREPILFRSVLHDRETGVALTMPPIPTPFHTAWELRRPDPDLAKISRTMRNYFFAVGAQGTMQVLTIVIMARFVTGL